MSENQSILTNQDCKDGFRKLYLPEECLIPKEIKNNPNLLPAVKIFFGEINGLANERGCCWGTDAEFAELKGVNKRTIQRYISSLESKGYIKTESVCVPYTNDEGEPRWKKDRKVWVEKKKMEMEIFKYLDERCYEDSTPVPYKMHDMNITWGIRGFMINMIYEAFHRMRDSKGMTGWECDAKCSLGIKITEDEVMTVNSLRKYIVECQKADLL